MSLFATLYTSAPSSLGDVAVVTFPGLHLAVEVDRVRIQTNAMEASIAYRTAPNFDLELFGFNSSISIYFAIDKQHSVEARSQLARAVRGFLNSTSADVAVLHLDTLVLKRLGKDAVCAQAYVDMLPEGDIGWTVVPMLEQPE
jgi:hypothetical protein